MLRTPLPAQLRPKNWDELVGQSHLIGPDGALSEFISAGRFLSQSVILHGPPGTGKTTIARLLATGGKFVELSALNVGVSTLRDEIQAAETRLNSFDQPTLMFVDEIHRFAKNQQEALLAAVEAGTITLVGATTENPGTSIVRALLSRCMVLELSPLSDQDLRTICFRALNSGLLGDDLTISEPAIAALVRHGAGDARRALTLLQAAAAKLSEGSRQIDVREISATGIERVIDFDTDGDYHYDTISAFIKSIRGSDVDASLQYLALMIAGGERPEFIGRRLMILAAEDVGLADPNALSIAVAANSAALQVGFPEARIPLAEATIYLALAPKSNSAYKAIDKAIRSVQDGRVEIPIHLTRKGADSYLYPHDYDPPLVPQEHRFGQERFFNPGKQGLELELAKRFEAIKRALRSPLD